MKVEKGRRPLDQILLERTQHSPTRTLAIHIVDDHLRDERVVEIGDLVSLADPGVDPNADASGLAVRGDPPRCRQKARRNVLCIDPAFDRVAAQDDILLRDGERLS